MTEDEMMAWAKFPWGTPPSVLADPDFKRLVARYDELKGEVAKVLADLNAKFTPPPEREWAVGDHGGLTTVWRRDPPDEGDFPI